MEQREPIFNVPGPVLVVLALMVGVHAGRSFVSPEMDEWLVTAGAFVTERFSGAGPEIAGGTIARFSAWVTHIFLHSDVTHLLFNSAWLLVFGSATARRLSPSAFFAFFILGGVAGAAAFLVSMGPPGGAMIGASGAVSALMGGTMRFMFSQLDSVGSFDFRADARVAPTMTLRAALLDRRVQSVMASLVLLNGLAAIGFGIATGDHAIAWEAHLGGFAFGIVTFGLFERVQSSIES